jgi:heme exporter protein D
MAALLGEHWGFIVAAYGFVVLILGTVIAITWIDGAQQKRAMAELEARGIRRRSEQAS